jgi:hypothetical protein
VRLTRIIGTPALEQLDPFLLLDEFSQCRLGPLRVADDEGVVLGLLDVTALGGDPGAVVEGMMRSAPTTYRPHVPVEETARRAAESRSGGRAVSG